MNDFTKELSSFDEMEVRKGEMAEMYEMEVQALKRQKVWSWHRIRKK